jgi:hypothetical protein
MSVTSTTSATHNKNRWLAIAAIVAVLPLFVIGASMMSGYGVNLRAFARATLNVVLAVKNHQAIAASNGDFRNIVFLHHSVGENLIAQGYVRDGFSAAGYRFWDQDYNWKGLHDPGGNRTGYSYNVPADNTDPDGLLTIFSQPVFGLPLNTLSGLMQHEVIAFKSCFPASGIASEAQLEERKAWYLKMREFFDEHPEKLFVVVTQPPLNPAETNAEAAMRARAFANWLRSDEFLKGHPNIVTFDLFDRLAEGNSQSPDFNMLRQDYREGADSHPTRIANEAIGPQFVDSVINAIGQYRQNRIRK